MKPIVTITLNPTIDAAAEAANIHPIRKVRTWSERYDPGGGGINAARVIQELGGLTVALYLSGGTTGAVPDGLLDDRGIVRRRIRIAGDTRISYAVHERSTGLEYRFVSEGPVVCSSEWESCLRILDEIDFDFVVGSGSLPRGVPVDFYAQVARIAARKNAKFVLDTSGDGLREAIGRGILLFTPSRGELEHLTRRELSNRAAQESTLVELIASGAAGIIALTLGRDGALLADREGLIRVEGLDVPVRSAVGAGDSFLAAMTLGLAQGRTVRASFLGVAAGTAAVMTPGTELCRRADVERLYAQISKNLEMTVR